MVNIDELARYIICLVLGKGSRKGSLLAFSRDHELNEEHIAILLVN